jgi:hypothetical protein
VASHRTPIDGAHFWTCSKQTLSLGVWSERSGIAVRTPSQLSSISYNAIDAQWKRKRNAEWTRWLSTQIVRRLCSVSSACARCIYGALRFQRNVSCLSKQWHANALIVQSSVTGPLHQATC